jgi:hypothetical protein
MNIKYEYAIWWVVFILNIIFIQNYYENLTQVISMICIVSSVYYIGLRTESFSKTFVKQKQEVSEKE